MDIHKRVEHQFFIQVRLHKLQATNISLHEHSYRLGGKAAVWPGCPRWDEDAGSCRGSDRCLKVSRQQHRSRCARAARGGICCSRTDGQGQQPREQQSCESLSLCGAAGLRPCPHLQSHRISSITRAAAALGGRCQPKGPGHRPYSHSYVEFEI